MSYLETASESTTTHMNNIHLDGLKYFDEKVCRVEIKDQVIPSRPNQCKSRKQKIFRVSYPLHNIAYQESEFPASINMVSCSQRSSQSNTQKQRRDKRRLIRQLVKETTDQLVLEEAIEAARQEQRDRDRRKELMKYLSQLRRKENKKIQRVKVLTKSELQSRNKAQNKSLANKCSTSA